MNSAKIPDYESLLSLMECARIGWWKADFITGELVLSDSLARLLGFDFGTVCVDDLLALIREDYRPRIQAGLRELAAGNHFDATFPTRLPEGEGWLHMQLVHKQSGPDRGQTLFGYMQQVETTTPTQAELATLRSGYRTLQRQSRHMDDVLDHLPVGYVRLRLLYDSDGRASDYLFLTINRTAQLTLGLTSEHYIGRTARETGVPVEEHIDKLAGIHLGDFLEEKWYAPRTRRHCRTFLYNTPDDATEIVLLALDITDVITVHEALDEQQKLLRNVVHNAPAGIEIYDREGTLVDLNVRDMEILGVAHREDILGVNLFDEPNFTEQTKARIHRGEAIDFSGCY